MGLWCKLCCWVVCGGGDGGGGEGVVNPPAILLYIISRFAYIKYFFLTTHSNFSVLNLKLGVQTNCPLAQMFFFCTLASAFPTSYYMKTVCSCWIWKLSNDACSLSLVPSASFLTQSDWLNNNFVLRI